MIRKIATVVAVAGVALTYAASANAMDFYAAPMNSGAPTNLPGEHLVPGVSESMQMVNAITQPIMQPMLAPGGMAPHAEGAMAAGGPMMMHHHHHHHMSMMKKHMMMKHMMMKHSMMKKKMMSSSSMPKQM